MKSNSIIASFKYAITGIITAFKSERNLKVHTLITIIVVIMGFVFDIKPGEWIACVTIIALVISAELFNTALEEMVNLLSPEIRDSAKKAKDISAGAVFILAVASVIIGIIIFLPYLFS